MIPDAIREGLTFDDVLLQPARSSVVPAQTDTRTALTRNIGLNISILSSAMDTGTESHLAIALAQKSGIGNVHRKMTLEPQGEKCGAGKTNGVGRNIISVYHASA